jgi:hypothetical protein
MLVEPNAIRILIQSRVDDLRATRLGQSSSGRLPRAN